jgi:hypothetical protein
VVETWKLTVHSTDTLQTLLTAMCDLRLFCCMGCVIDANSSLLCTAANLTAIELRSAQIRLHRKVIERQQDGCKSDGRSHPTVIQDESGEDGTEHEYYLQCCT